MAVREARAGKPEGADAGKMKRRFVGFALMQALLGKNLVFSQIALRYESQGFFGLNPTYTR
jgi:hypothetical protein